MILCAGRRKPHFEIGNNSGGPLFRIGALDAYFHYDNYDNWEAENNGKNKPSVPTVIAGGNNGIFSIGAYSVGVFMSWFTVMRCKLPVRRQIFCAASVMQWCLWGI